MVDLQGKVIAVDGSKITILPKHNDLRDPLEFQADELRKRKRKLDVDDDEEEESQPRCSKRMKKVAPWP